MINNTEQISEISNKISDSDEHEHARKELASVMATIVGLNEGYENGIRDDISTVLATLDSQKRKEMLSELEEITREAGWKLAHEVITNSRDIDKQIEIISARNDKKVNSIDSDVHKYEQKIIRPEEINDLEHWREGMEKVPCFWIPKKQDILQYVKTAVEVHKISQREGKIKVVDVGGGSGFLGKLIADEATKQGIALEVIVVDPDVNLIEKAKVIYEDTSNLKFEVGSAKQALEMFGPKLDVSEKNEFTKLQNESTEITETGRAELVRISALMASLEGLSEDGFYLPSIVSLLTGAYGDTAINILNESGVVPDGTMSIEEIRNSISDYYISRSDYYHQEIVKIHERQENIYTAKETEHSQIDVVVNSWMPAGIDFTRELRMMGPAAIIYTQNDEVTGSGGMYSDSAPYYVLGVDCSYESGSSYKEIMSWPVVPWYLARSTFYDDHNFIEIQMRNDIKITKEELKTAVPEKDDRYKWEQYLQNRIGFTLDSS